MATSETPTPARAPARASRGPKILAALLAGASLEAIAQAEQVKVKRIETLLRRELERRWIAPGRAYARLQIARLDALCARLSEKAEKGDLGAIDRILRILDRLDRYHGFTRVINAQQRYDPAAKDRLMARINRAAARAIAETEGKEAAA
jgi:hypothetical protein